MVEWRCLFLLLLFLLPVSSESDSTTPCSDMGVLDEELGLCLTKADFPCHSVGVDCVSNAFCSAADKYICKCRKGFYKNSNGYCVHGFFGTCMTITDCDADKALICQSGKGQCKCPFPDQFYDMVAKKCIVYYGRNCTGALGCDSNFLCRNQTCLCPEGLDLTKTKDKCLAGLGKVCSKQEDCDSSRLLLCLHGQCQCQHPLQEYSSQLGMCVGLEGAHCNLSSRGGLEHEYYYTANLFCVEGTRCQPILGGNWVGMCKADEYMSFIMQQLFLALMISLVSGLMILLLDLFLESGRKNSRSAPVKNDDDCETATTTTMISCIHEDNPELTPLPPISQSESESETKPEQNGEA